MIVALAQAAAVKRGGRRYAAALSDVPRCCAALDMAECPEGGDTCCTSVGLPSNCAALRTRAACEHSRPRAGGAGAVHGRELCAWLGGQCTAASLADCAEPPVRGAPDYYGESAGFQRSCGSGANSQCPGLLEAIERYARAHDVATRAAEPVEGMGAARLLVIRDHWRNVGMGFMPAHIATLVLYAMATGLYVYVENYGRYDWTRYFTGAHGLDLRWTPAKQRMWRARFLRAGVARSHIEVLHEDGSKRGDEDWEEHLSAQLANASTRWIRLNGWATTINWGRVLRPALPAAIANRRRLAPAHVLSTLWPLYPIAGTTARRGGAPSWMCQSCAVWANYRPRAVLHRRLLGSPIAASTPLACLKARTMYAEDKRFFPDELAPSLEAIDALWRSYSGRLGDVTYWGPRDRLRCAGTGAAGAGTGAAGAGTTRAGRGAGKQLVMPSAAIHCMEAVRARMGPAARLFVAVDAPRLQQVVFTLMGERAFITPGVGIDPTNEYRDRRGPSNKEQAVGKQDLAERNLVKVSLDYFIQGFCLSSMTLRPSAFYAAAMQRTAVLRAHIADSVASAASANATTGGPGGRPGVAQCLGRDGCQRDLCGWHSCNLNQ